MEQPVMEPPSRNSAGFEPNDFTTEEGVPPRQADPTRCDSPLVGVLCGFDERGAPLVRLGGILEGNPVPARSVVPLSSADVGREAVLLLERGDPTRPLVMGVLRVPQAEPVRTASEGEKLIFTAEREIVFRCGEASITLTRAGKVLIRGAYVVTKSSGANRIKGAVVEIN